MTRMAGEIIKTIDAACKGRSPTASPPPSSSTTTPAPVAPGGDDGAFSEEEECMIEAAIQQSLADLARSAQVMEVSLTKKSHEVETPAAAPAPSPAPAAVVVGEVAAPAPTTTPASAAPSSIPVKEAAPTPITPLPTEAVTPSLVTERSPASVPTSTATTTTTAAPTTSAYPAPTASTQLIARFVAHVTVTDDVAVSPGARLGKAWRIANAGTTPWPEGTCLVFIEGAGMGAPDVVPIPHPVNPGCDVEVAVPITAPPTAGRYQANFRLTAPDHVTGELTRRFGPRLWVDLFVDVDPDSAAPGEGGAGPMEAALAALPSDTPIPPPEVIGHTHFDPDFTEEGPWLVLEQTNPYASRVLAALSSPTRTDDATTYASQLGELLSMGFDDGDANLRLLVQHKGDIEAAIAGLCETTTPTGTAV